MVISFLVVAVVRFLLSKPFFCCQFWRKIRWWKRENWPFFTDFKLALILFDRSKLAGKMMIIIIRHHLFFHQKKFHFFFFSLRILWTFLFCFFSSNFWVSSNFYFPFNFLFFFFFINPLCRRLIFIINPGQFWIFTLGIIIKRNLYGKFFFIYVFLPRCCPLSGLLGKWAIF